VDPSCLPALIGVTRHVLALYDRLLRGDEDAAAEVDALAKVVDGR
jgi:hypothetical protein